LEKTPQNKEAYYYVTNKDLLVEIASFKETGKFSEELGRMVLCIARGISNRANYAGYTWKEDMVAEAALTVVKYLKNFNPEKSSNAFSYISQICFNAFNNYLNKQKKHSKIKNQLFENRERIDHMELGEDERAINYSAIIE
jgi:DNA-directed RNA polymerase specialized sigma subunit